MKPIPKELHAYILRSPTPSRPWWSYLPDAGTFIRRDGYVRESEADFAALDSTNPLPPPPILVGQVWASPLSGGRWRVSVIAGVVHESDGTLTITFANDRLEPGSWLYSHSILLACPYGYAPWSGPEVP